MTSNTLRGYTCDEVWEMMREHQNEEILTAKGLPFTYRTKTITRSTFEAAWNRVLENPRAITGPKKLNVFGAPYLWAVFKMLELVPFGAANCPPDRSGQDME